jgi:hypothetical protein
MDILHRKAGAGDAVGKGSSHHFLLDRSVSFGVAKRVFWVPPFALNFFLEVLKND